MKNLYYLPVLMIVGFALVSPVFAASCPGGSPEGAVCLDNPLGNKTEATQVIGRIIQGALGVLGSLALLMLIWGGFQWLTSAGNTEKIEKGTSTMLWAIIGVIVVMSSFILVQTVIRVLTEGK